MEQIKVAFWEKDDGYLKIPNEEVFLE